MTQPTQDTAVHVRALETVLRLEAEDHETAAALRAQWSRCLASNEESDTDIVIPVSGTAGPLPETFGYALASQVTAHAIEALAGRALMFHSAGLSDDTGQVVALVAEGSTNAQVAARLFVSSETVKTHLSHVYTKLDVPNRAALSAAYVRRAAGPADD